ncbi:hypothetical protein HETIRDRAFT_315772 [Heterobasidion irregulare TC 32-1]|uniref:Uncharacterized protein n=1 Tax=Heterobasidion irregulare (strain TC 32-1) TaxID=747525 RepID=W4KA42_HETIT|nr:uncharacterized protein HETIRDRAFT_315772 [Heterobasidion irregulare TC 32-1]ETW82648.1 hypothetical protein HETIRDRAFT_315772 [Heterobasidion irregulare TC 32-1]
MPVGAVSLPCKIFCIEEQYLASKRRVLNPFRHPSRQSKIRLDERMADPQQQRFPRMRRQLSNM